MKKSYLAAAALAAGLALPGSPALAQANEIVIGITIVTTGPAAALGIPERNSLEFVAKEIGGVPLKVIVLDDGGDPTAATTNARRFVTESKADIIMGSSTTPPTIAVSTVANEAGIPHFALAPLPINEARMKWSVAMPQPIPIMGKVLYEHMKAHAIKSVLQKVPQVNVAEIDDVICGCAQPSGQQGQNVARIGALIAGLPPSVAATTTSMDSRSPRVT